MAVASAPLGASTWVGPDTGPACPLCLRALKGASLEEHLAGAGHSSHDPACERCHKHFSTFEALTEHLYGFKASRSCGPVFATTGCRSCLGFFADGEALKAHRCPFAHTSPAAAPQTPPPRARDAPPLPVALDCEMAAVLCADGRVRDAAVRVCVVDEAERVLLHSLISPAGPVVDYRTEYTGLVAGDLDGAPSLDVVRARVVSILSGCEGEGLSPEETASQPVPRLLVGHGLENDLAVLHLSHPASLLRDTALHAPLQRATTGKAHKLRDLVALHLGYAIQAAGAAHDPEEDAVGAMRLYRRVKCLARRHQEQAARDNAALLRAQGGGGYAAAARGGSSDAPAPAEAALWEAATCWCLDPPGVDAVKGCH